MWNYLRRAGILVLIFVMSQNLNAKDKSQEDALFKNLAESLSKVENKLTNRTVAVYGFEVIGKPGDNYAVFATEKLTHQLVSIGRLKVVERSRIDKVLKEQSLSMTGIIDPDTAARIGKILSVDAVIIGTIHITENNSEFFARVIQSETGVILASADKKMSEAGTVDEDDAAEKATAKKEDELARVSILPFEDRTNSKNFQYLSESLSDAVDASMSKDFLYQRTDNKEVKKVLFDIQQEIIKSKLQESGKTAKKTTEPVKPAPQKEKEKKTADTAKEGAADEKTAEKQIEKRVKTEEELQLDKEQLNLVKKAAGKLNSDIVVYGSYFYDLETNELVFAATLYLGLSNAVKELDETRNVVDNTLFKATEKVSKNLVAEIHTMIEEAEKTTQGKTKESKKEGKEAEVKKPDEKVALTRKVAMTQAPDWGSKKFSISLLPGFFMDIAPIEGCGICAIPLHLSARYWLIPNLYLGLTLSAGGAKSGGVPFFTGAPPWSAFDAMAQVGYSLPVQRWLFSVDLGGGYYVIIDQNKGKYYNPLYGARLGAEVLLTGFFSVGLSANVRMYYDQPKPIFLGGLSLSLNFVM